VNLERLNEHDHFAYARAVLGEIAHISDEWAGIPLPLEDHALVIEPTYPYAKELAKLGQRELPPEDLSHITKRSHFWSTHRRSEVLIWSNRGKIEWGIVPGMHHITQDLKTVGASVVWGIEQETNAFQLLAEHVSSHQFKQYVLTGMFLEQSRRSHIHYVFRRLRPTVAVSSQGGTLRILAALCLHPIAYYEGSWAGAMCPTDDLIAHLMLMRGDEHMFWRRANQHRAYRPEAGL